MNQCCGKGAKDGHTDIADYIEPSDRARGSK